MAVALKKHFKAGPGQYACGDKFLGVEMSNQLDLAKKSYRSTSLSELSELLHNNIHEVRMTALLILTIKFGEAKTEQDQQEIVDFYLDHLNAINNWDLVDATAEKILGVYLINRDRSLLVKLAKSKRLWRERLAVVTTLFFAKNNDFTTSFELIKFFRGHPHPLIHQAVGKVMKEISKRDPQAADKFLAEIYKKMSSGMMKQAISGFGDERQKAYKLGSR